MNWMIPAVMSIFGGIMGYNAGKEAEGLAKEQEMLAEQNAILEKRELNEQIRRQEEQDSKLRASALARAAASGTRLSGTSMDTLTHMQDEQERQLDWTRTAGASRIRLNLESARLDAKTNKMRAKTQQQEAIMGGIMGAFGFAEKGGVFGATSNWGSTWSLKKSGILNPSKYSSPSHHSW